MEPDELMEGIGEELMKAIKNMSKSKDIDEKLKYSQIVKNLSDSLDTFINVSSTMLDFVDDDEGSMLF